MLKRLLKLILWIAGLYLTYKALSAIGRAYIHSTLNNNPYLNADDSFDEFGVGFMLFVCAIFTLGILWIIGRWVVTGRHPFE